MRYKFFDVVEEPLIGSRKTHEYSVVNRHGDYEIGRIAWYGEWRQFCFFPAEETVWSDGCLADVRDALAKIAAARKANK